MLYEVVNEAAVAYKGHIPDDCYREPYMPREELEREFAIMAFYGYEGEDGLLGAVGFQPVRDVTLLRHLYVRPECQGQGIGSLLLRQVVGLTRTPRLLIGMWADARWAIRFYAKPESTEGDRRGSRWPRMPA